MKTDITTTLANLAVAIAEKEEDIKTLVDRVHELTEQCNKLNNDRKLVNADNLQAYMRFLDEEGICADCPLSACCDVFSVKFQPGISLCHFLATTEMKAKQNPTWPSAGCSYEDTENALLTEQEHNGKLTKEIERLTAILKERDAEIEKLRVSEIKPTQTYPESYVLDKDDEVIIGGMFFHELGTQYIGKVLVVKDSRVRVKIEEGQRRGEYNIPHDYLTPLVEEKK